MTAVAPRPLAIGIDFGTANTRVAVFRNDKVEIIPDVHGNLSFPSYVAFNMLGRSVGSTARSRAILNPEGTVYNMKRMLGRNFSDVNIETEIESVLYEVVDLGEPLARVSYKGKPKYLNAIECLAMLLEHAKSNAETYLGHQILHAIITVPVLFNTIQWQAVKVAAKLAGLSLIDVLSTPSAILSTRSLEQLNKEGSILNVLVLDMGAGYFNVGLAVMEAGILEMRALAGEEWIGRNSIESRLFQYVLIKAKHQGISIETNKRALRRLQSACETAMRDLSSSEHTQIFIESLGSDDQDFQTTISHSILEELCKDLFRVTLKCIDRVISEGRADKGSIHEVILAGGYSRLPILKRLWAIHLSATIPMRYIEDAEVIGAALHAAKLSGDTTSKNHYEMLLLDVLPIAISIQISGGLSTILVEANTMIPTCKTYYFEWNRKHGGLVHRHESPPALNPEQPAWKRADKLLVSLLEGSPENSVGNDILLGVADLAKVLPEYINRDPIFLVRVDVDARKHIFVKFRSLEYGKEFNLVVRRDWDKLWENQLDDMKSNMEHYRAQDQAEVAVNAARYALDKDLAILRGRLNTVPVPAGPAIQWIQEVNEWMDDNPQATLEEINTVQDALNEMMRCAVDGSLEADGTTNPLIRARQMEPPNETDETIIPPNTNTLSRDSGSNGANSQLATLEQSTANTHGKLKALKITEPSELPDLDSIFSSTGQQTPGIYTDVNFERIAIYLRNSNKVGWSTTPRLYTVLRLVDSIDLLDDFLRLRINDMWFPFTTASLPPSLPPAVKSKFLEVQSLAYSESKLHRLENGGRHVHLSKDDPKPFEVFARLGRGAHGSVDKVMSVLSQKEYARKLFKKSSGWRKEDVQSFLTELGILKRVHHKHCVQLVATYSDPKYFAILMSPVGDCNLAEYYQLAGNHPDKLSLLRSFFGCLTSGVQYLHDSMIRHRDIKPQNVIIKGGHVFLADFGVAFSWENLTRGTTTADSSKTLVYAAPEVVRVEPRNSAADMWSLGCIFFEMATVLGGRSVQDLRDYFMTASESRSFHANILNLSTWRDQMHQTLAKHEIPFEWALSMLQDNPKRRPTAAEAFEIMVRESDQSGVLFCGSCCLDGGGSNTDSEVDDGHLWGDGED